MICSARLVLLFAGFAAASNQAAAQEAWQIVAEDGEFIESGDRLKRGTTIARQRLVPMQLAVVNGDVERADGKDRWAKGGDQLFGVEVAGFNAFCTLQTKLNVTLGMLLMPKPTDMLKQDCFVDSDGDGLLDRRFEADPGIGVLPNISRARPSTFQELAPVGFSVIDPSEFADDAWVEIQYRSGGKKPDKPAKFRIRYRYDGKTQALTSQIAGGNAGNPQRTSILDSLFEITLNDTGNLSAEVIEPMSGTFGVIARIEYR